VIERSREASALLATVEHAEPEAVSACAGWTTHDVVAHVTGIAVELRRHLDPYLQGDPVPTTRNFEEREAPLQALKHGELLRRFDAEDQRVRAALSDVLADDPDAVIAWTGRQMAVAKFIPHLRNEHALHRWDIAGDDDISLTLLAGSDLIEHSVSVLGQILLVAGRKHDPDPDSEFHVRLRADGQRDLRVLVQGGTASLAWADNNRDEPTVDLDAAARQLFIWGRRPDSHNRVSSHLSQPQLARLQALLSGY
jgi:hypothetical protein